MAEGDKPIKGVEAWYTFTHALAFSVPKSLARSRNARRSLRALMRAGR